MKHSYWIALALLFSSTSANAVFFGQAGPASPVPIIVFSPGGPVTVPDSASSGYVVSTITVSMSDGSGFSGSLTVTANPGNTVAISGSQLQLARNLSSADDGTIGPFTITATQ